MEKIPSLIAMEHVKELKKIIIHSVNDYEAFSALIDTIYTSDLNGANDSKDVKDFKDVKESGYEIFIDDDYSYDKFYKKILARNFVINKRVFHYERNLTNFMPYEVVLPVGQGFSFRNFSIELKDAVIALVKDSSFDEYIKNHFIDKFDFKISQPNFSNNSIILLYSQDKIIGMFHTNLTGTLGNVSYFCLRNEFKGRGLGVLLHQKAINNLFERGATIYAGGTASDNIQMQKIFQHNQCRYVKSRLIFKSFVDKI